MSGQGERGDPRRRVSKAGAEARMKAVAIVVRSPLLKDPSQVVLPEWNQEVDRGRLLCGVPSGIPRDEVFADSRHLLK